MSKKRGRSLSEEDLAAWRNVARSATPLHPSRKPLASRLPSVPAVSPSPPAKSPEPLSEFHLGQKVYDHSKGHNLTPTLEARLAAAPVRMDKKTYRSMKKGKLRPERKLDLHGMSLAQAHPTLTRFILSAQAEGCRLVLVVTGKGKSGRDDGGPIPVPRGVLRNQVPQWLHLPPLRTLVLQVADAHASHGGSGAYYVYLARRR